MLENIDLKEEEFTVPTAKALVKKFLVEQRQLLCEKDNLFWRWIFAMNPESLYVEKEDLPLEFFKKVFNKLEFQQKLKVWVEEYEVISELEEEDR